MTCVQAMVIKYLEIHSITRIKIDASDQYHDGGAQEANETKRNDGTAS